ncbi:hypothetical protein IWX75_000571 [Arthrobacter sp. CAN_A6]|uniref:reverse transcriptase family protein n=1 Tax=Arthrobacter sp. CAN_A6 TaxID=2787721 RepID=UPI0018CBA417
MRWVPAEAESARGAPSSPGLPRGTQIDQDKAPQARDSAPRSTEPARTDRSAGAHRSLSTTSSISTGSRVLARAPHPSTEGLASALAHAFLAADPWSKPGLIAAGAITLGARRRWLGPLAADVLKAYHRPPTDAPRELARFIAQAPAFGAAVARAAEKGAPIPVARYAVASAAAGASAGIPAGVGALAQFLDLTVGELEWFADTGHWNRRARPGPLRHYRYAWRTRRGRVPRLLEVPGPRLKAVQRKVLHQLLGSIPLHDAAHGFVPGRSAGTGAGQHLGTEMLISLDLRTFFSSIGAGRVHGIFRQAGMPEAVAHLLTGICTAAVPAAVLTRMPDGGSPDERLALRRALAAAHLPQGAPSSPALANLSVRRLDSRLAGWAEATGAVYTRYADDLAFSGSGLLPRRADAFVRGVERIVTSEGHLVNPRKTRVKGAAVRQTVTGVVVNSVPNVPRPVFDELKAILHNCVTDGPASQNGARGPVHPNFRAHLLGRISWVESLNPARGRRLRKEFDRIRW